MLVQGSQQQKKLVLTKAKNTSKKDKNNTPGYRKQDT
jgi:hypothetical protein